MRRAPRLLFRSNIHTHYSGYILMNAKIALAAALAALAIAGGGRAPRHFKEEQER